jgi:NADPH2:quinone reductase
MNSPQHSTGLQMRSTVKSTGQLLLTLESVVTPAPEPDEVVVRIEAAPINPSDIALLFGPADMETTEACGTPTQPTVTAVIPGKSMRSLTARWDQSLPVGNEGAGTVVAAGSSADAQALLGKVVAVIGGAMYSQYRCVKLSQCLPLPLGTTPEQGASCFVNPLTALAMVEAMRREGHKALVHTAAASNLGQMLNKICLQDGIALINIVRKSEQEALLRSQGAEYVLNMGSATFQHDLTQALIATGATLAFDAVGGGKLAGQILTCMESAITSAAKEYSRYGSTTLKQVYIYGLLDMGAIELPRDFGFSWGVGGWLLSPFLEKIGTEATQAMKQRIIQELGTTFASSYAKDISLTEALDLKSIAAYGKQATGAKYLIRPHKSQ